MKLSIFLLIALAPSITFAQCPGFAGCAQNGARADGTVRPETFAQQPLRLYDAQGRFRGTDSPNPYQPDSLANSYSPYGNRFSPDSVYNEFGAGNRFYGNDSYLRREQGEE